MSEYSTYAVCCGGADHCQQLPEGEGAFVCARQFSEERAGGRGTGARGEDGEGCKARSVRRGSLQAMAQAGVPLELLMRFSGHTQEKTLLRYLNWGALTANLQGAMKEAGKALIA